MTDRAWAIFNYSLAGFTLAYFGAHVLWAVMR